MHRHRFRGFVDKTPVQHASGHPGVGVGFMACPVAVYPGMMAQVMLWQQAYQIAFEQARAVLQPSRVERLLTASWN